MIRDNRFRKMLSAILFLILGGTMMLGSSGCGAKNDAVKKYRIDYDGYMEWYGNAKEEYAAGEEVLLYYGIYAADTYYYFYLDGESLDCEYDEEKGLVIRFTMPDHDVKLTCEPVSAADDTIPTEPEGAEVMLLDSYRSTVATDGGDGYDEITLMSYTDDELRMNVYHQYGGENETVTAYIVPYEAIDRCYEAIEKHKMREWDELDETEEITGGLLVCKFRDGDSYTRVTSEQMPQGGEAAFAEIESILREYVSDEYLAEE